MILEMEFQTTLNWTQYYSGVYYYFFLVAGLSTGTEHLALKTQGECQS